MGLLDGTDSFLACDPQVDALPAGLDLGDLTSNATLSEAEVMFLGMLATQLGTTLPMLLHVIFSLLTARVLEGNTSSHGTASAGRCLICHVVSNREQHAAVRGVVGCFDTSVPVVVDFQQGESLARLCKRTCSAFASALSLVTTLPRGSFMTGTVDGAAAEGAVAGAAGDLFERVPHVNIQYAPPTTATAPLMPPVDMLAAGEPDNQEYYGELLRTHPLQRTQQTRWGLLLRVSLPTAARAASSGVTQHGDPGSGSTTAQVQIDSTAKLQIFAECRPLAVVLAFCLPRLIHQLHAAPSPTDADLLDMTDSVIAVARRASTQVCKAMARVTPSRSEEPFIWFKLLERQRRWYVHDAQLQLVRDSQNRFVPTPANPFSFSQLDKLAERSFLDKLNVPQPRLITRIPIDQLRHKLPQFATANQAASFVMKPVGAGHSFGVTIVRQGIDVTRGGVPFDVHAVAAELCDMAAVGGCTHQGQFFPFNFSSVLLEECVVDEMGGKHHATSVQSPHCRAHTLSQILLCLTLLPCCPTLEESMPSDYKVFLLGSALLWVQLHFRERGLAWVAFVDADFKLLEQPAWDPATCWRTHNACVVTDSAMVSARRPTCWTEMISHAQRLGGQLSMFVRLDWYADAIHGPLMGEITLFPHMLQPRSFYSTWANERVRALWRDCDGCAAPGSFFSVASAFRAIGMGVEDNPAQELSEKSLVDAQPQVERARHQGSILAQTERKLANMASETTGLMSFIKVVSNVTSEAPSLLSFVPKVDAPWAFSMAMSTHTSNVHDRVAACPQITFAALRDWIDRFDLSEWNVRPGDRVALLIANGHELAASLLATMARYCAVPLDPGVPPLHLTAEVQARAARALIVLQSTPEAAKVQSAGESAPLGAAVVQLKSSTTQFRLPQLPPSPSESIHTLGRASTVLNGPADLVLLLRTSGTTGAPKSVGFSLRRLLTAGAGIATSLQLTSDDSGVSMLPLHHVGGISCNLVAPLLASSPMRFARSFDASRFFDVLALDVSWIYLVPTLWSLVLQYAVEVSAKAQPHLSFVPHSSHSIGLWTPAHSILALVFHVYSILLYARIGNGSACGLSEMRAARCHTSLPLTCTGSLAKA